MYCDDPSGVLIPSTTRYSQLYRVESSYTEQVIRSRIFFIFRVGYTEQAISAIPSRLYRVGYFCYSKQTISEQTISEKTISEQTFSEYTSSDYSEQTISAIRSKVFLLIPGRTFLLFRVRYTEQNISAILGGLHISNPLQKTIYQYIYILYIYIYVYIHIYV